MRFNEWISSLVFLVFAGAGAQASECVPAAEMQEIASHFTQFQTLADKGEYCFDDSQTSHLLAGIMFMRKTHFATAQPRSPDDLFSGQFKDDWYGYFIGRITDFQVQSSCPVGVVAYVSFFSSSMFVCPLALTSNFTALDRASVFMHEARHIDGYPHTTCSHGARAGLRGACDDRISDAGSYAVTVETYSQISKYAGDLHPAMRAYARSSAIVYADEAFESEVRINRVSQFMLLTNDRKFHSLNLQNGIETKDLGESPVLGRIAMRAQFMVLFPDDKSEIARYVFANNEGETAQTAGDIAGDYNKSTPTERAKFVDTYSGGQWNVRLFKDKARFRCDPTSNTMSEVVLSEVPAGVIYPEGYSRSLDVAYLVNESGSLSEMGCDSGGNPFVRRSGLNLDQTYKRIQKVGNDVVGLTKDGRLFRITGSKSAALQTPYDGRVYDLVPNQNVEFLDAN